MEDPFICLQGIGASHSIRPCCCHEESSHQGPERRQVHCCHHLHNHDSSAHQCAGPLCAEREVHECLCRGVQYVSDDCVLRGAHLPLHSQGVLRGGGGRWVRGEG